MRAGRRARVPPRAVALAGALWGIGANAYLVARSVDETVPSFLQNPTARHDDLVHAFVGGACFTAALALLLVRRVPEVVRLVVVAVLAVTGVTFTAEAIVLSAQPNALVGLVVIALPPFVLLAMGVVAVAFARGRPLLGGVLAVLLALSVAVLDLFVIDDPFREATVFLGLHANWRPEPDVENAFVDGAGNVWGVQPWRIASPSALSLRRDGRFVELEERAHGWPPTIVGVDGSGATWIASSRLDDPFDPVIERYHDDRLDQVPAPERRLPPFDAVAVDRRGHRFYALHTDFGIPARMVLEIHDGGRWLARVTPLVVDERPRAIDLAVDPDGRVWVWHGESADRVYIFESGVWSVVRLGFEASPGDVGHDPITLDPYDVFVAGPEGSLWMFDEGTRRLVQPPVTSGEAVSIPLPAGCTPLAFDGEARVWCAGRGRLRVVDASGDVVYDSLAQGLPSFRVESVAIGEEEAWVAVTRGDARQLLRFDHAAALG